MSLKRPKWNEDLTEEMLPGIKKTKNINSDYECHQCDYYRPYGRGNEYTGRCRFSQKTVKIHREACIDFKARPNVVCNNCMKNAVSNKDHLELCIFCRASLIVSYKRAYS